LGSVPGYIIAADFYLADFNTHLQYFSRLFLPYTR
jgi:hypothetical protein